MIEPTHLYHTMKNKAARWPAVVVTLFASATSAMAHHLPPGFEDVDEFDHAQQMAPSGSRRLIARKASASSADAGSPTSRH